MPIALDHVGLTAYGTYATLSAVLALVSLSESGVSVEVTRRVAAAAGAGDEPALRTAVREGTTLLSLIGAVVLMLGLAAVRPIISFTFPHAVGAERSELILVLSGIIVQLAVGIALSAYFSVLSGLQRTDYGAYVGLALRVIGVVLIVVLADQGLRLQALFYAGVASSVLGWLGSYLAVLRVRPGMHFALTRPQLRRLTPYFGVSLVVISGNISNIFDYQFDKVVITHFEGAGSAGAYQIGTTLSTSGIALVLAPIGLLMAGSAELSVSDPAKLARLQRVMTQGTYALAAGLLFGIAAFAAKFIPLWLGSNYEGAAHATQLLSVALLFNAWSAPWYYYALGRGWLKEVAYSALANAGVNAVSSYLLTQQFGLVGALVGSLAGNGVGMLTFYVLLRRRERQPWLLPARRPTVIAALTALGAYAACTLTPTTYPVFVGLAAAWLVLTALLLQLTGCLPIRLTLKRSAPLVHVRLST